MNVKHLRTQNDYDQVRKLIQTADYVDLYLCQHKIVSLVRPVFKAIRYGPHQSHESLIISLMSELKSKLSRFQVSSQKCNYLLRLLKQAQSKFTIPYASTNNIDRVEGPDFSQSYQTVKKMLYKNQEGHYGYQQLKYEEMKEVNNQVEGIVKGHIKLMNPECVGCSQRFYKEWRITHSYLSTIPILLVPELIYTELSKAFCAGLNSLTGAIILVGCVFEHQAIVSCAKHLNLRQVDERMKGIRSVITPEIKSDCYTIQEVPIYPDIFTVQIGPEPEYLLRLRVQPRDISSLYNMKTTLEGERVIYKAFVCKQSQENVNFCQYQLLQKQENYHEIIEKHQYEGKFHYTHDCLKPEPTKYEEPVYEEDEVYEKDKSFELKGCGNNDKFSSDLENMFYDYSNFTILIFKKEEEELLRYILKQFNKKGKKRILEVKYRNKESDLLVAYIMGHDYNHEVVKNVWEDIEDKDKISCHMVTKNIHISNPTSSHHDSFKSWKYFNQEYEKLFNPSTIAKKYSQVQGKYHFYMVCEHTKHAFMVFLLMDMLNFRPVFEAEDGVEALVDLDKLYE